MYKKILASILSLALVFSLAAVPANAKADKTEQQIDAEAYMNYVINYVSLADFLNPLSSSENDLFELAIFQTLNSLMFASLYGAPQSSIDAYKAEVSAAINLFVLPDVMTDAFCEYINGYLEPAFTYLTPGYDKSFFTAESVASYENAKKAFSEVCEQHSETYNEDVYAAGKAVIFAFSSLQPVENYNNLALASVADNIRKFFPEENFIEESNLIIDAFISELKALSSSPEIISNEAIVSLFDTFSPEELVFSVLGEACQIIANTDILSHSQDYTAESFSELTDAYNAVLSAVQAGNAELDSLIEAYYQAFYSLEETPLFMLKMLYESTEFLEGGAVADELQFTKESYAPYAVAKQNAANLLDGGEATKEEIFSAYDALEKAIDGLVQSPLYDYINTYNSIKTITSVFGEFLTDSSLEALTTALEAFEALIGSGSEDESAYEGALQQLVFAMDNVEMIVSAQAMAVLAEIKAEYAFMQPEDFYPDNLALLVAAVYELEESWQNDAPDDVLSSLIEKLQTAYFNNKLVPLAYAKRTLNNVSSVFEEDTSVYTQESFVAFNEAYTVLTAAVSSTAGTGTPELYDLADALNDAYMALTLTVRADAYSTLNNIQDEIFKYDGIYSDAFMLEVNEKTEEMYAFLENQDLTDDEISAHLEQYLDYIFGYVFAHDSGDVDGDGDVTIADAVLAFLNIAGKKELCGAQSVAADLDASGNVTLVDAILLFIMVAKTA